METTSTEYEKAVVPPPLPPPSLARFSAWDAILRVLLLAASVVAVVVMVTSNQTKLILVPGIPFLIPNPAKFSYSPAFIYFVAAFGVAILYSVITAIASFSLISKPIPAKRLLILITLDVLMLGIAASATGAAGGVGYIGLKGNSHIHWSKVCDLYGKFCRHIGASVAVGLVGSIVLVLLVISNACSLYRRVEHKC